ncbi:hypothetical protein Y032_0249g132 [Ancylostoma ceylanicum]|nr:hypothetical protein Y032_0249g132 [Ancylostoma ceylanicum]
MDVAGAVAQIRGCSCGVQAAPSRTAPPKWSDNCTLAPLKNEVLLTSVAFCIHLLNQRDEETKDLLISPTRGRSVIIDSSEP